MGRTKDERTLAGYEPNRSGSYGGFLDSLIQQKPDKRNIRDRLAEYLSLLLGGSKSSVGKAHDKASSCHARRKHRTDNPTKRRAYLSRFPTAKLPIQIRHMGFRAKPFVLC